MRIIRKAIRVLKKIAFILLSIFCRIFCRINKKRIVCWSYGFKQYSCNPRYIAEYLVKNHRSEFEIFWIQDENTDMSDLDKDIKHVKPYSLRYFIVVSSAKILITNSRTDIFAECFFKKKNQLYIQTWHGLLPLKKIEKDAEKVLSDRYVYMSKRDSRICNLMLSGSRYSTENIKKAFWYDGEILEKGLPRNEILFKNNTSIKQKIVDKYNLPETAKILLYAPTFRQDYTLDYYISDWNNILPALEEKFNGEFYVMLRLHPNTLVYNVNICTLLKHNKIVDVTHYSDMQELLASCDVLITDYSSSMFEAAIVHKPCFIYAPDSDKYDRGFYFNIRELPFPYAEYLDELTSNIRNFDNTVYETNINKFNRLVGTVQEPDKANEELYAWLKNKL